MNFENEIAQIIIARNLFNEIDFDTFNEKNIDVLINFLTHIECEMWRARTKIEYKLNRK